MTESTFAFCVEGELKTEFTKPAKAKDRTAAQILREMMHAYVAEETPPTPDYIEWLTRKVARRTFLPSKCNALHGGKCRA